MRVEHHPTGHRFLAPLPEGNGVLVYQMASNNMMDIISTVVPSSARGRGVGGALVEAALQHARAHGFRVIPSCWYVSTWVGQHPEYQDLLEE